MQFFVLHHLLPALKGRFLLILKPVLRSSVFFSFSSHIAIAPDMTSNNLSPKPKEIISAKSLKDTLGERYFVIQRSPLSGATGGFLNPFFSTSHLGLKDTWETKPGNSFTYPFSFLRAVSFSFGSNTSWDSPLP